MTGQTQKGQLPHESVLVCSSAMLGQPGSPGATGDLRDCITGVATLLVCVLRRKATAMDSSAKNKLSICDVDGTWWNV